MTDNEYKYNLIKEGSIFIKDELKKKGKEYGIVKLEKKYIYALTEAIDLQAVSPLVSPNFSSRIEKFLLPRFNEINEILFSNNTLPLELNVEISKENINDIVKGLTFSNVVVRLSEKGYSAEELRNLLKKVKFSKFK